MSVEMGGPNGVVNSEGFFRVTRPDGTKYGFTQTSQRRVERKLSPLERFIDKVFNRGEYQRRLRGVEAGSNGVRMHMASGRVIDPGIES